MKKLVIIFFSLFLVLAASAQRGHYRGGGHYHGGRGHVIVSVGGYTPYWGYGYGYPWAYSPYYMNAAPSELELKIEDIRADYQDKIWSARHDKSLSRSERKQIIHNLKRDRSKAIIQAKENYYKEENND